MVQVTTVSGSLDAHKEARGWHVDDCGYLYIRGEKGNVAAYAKDAWTSVETTN